MKRPYEDNPEFVPEWDVHRDAAGKPVTIDFDCQYMTRQSLPRPLTDEEIAAVRRAVRILRSVCSAEGSTQYLGAVRDGVFDWTTPNAHKSRLLGRIIHEGKPPTRTKPPIEYAEPRWDLMPGGDPFDGS